MKNLSEALKSSRVGDGHFDCSDEYYTEDLKLALISLLDEVVPEEMVEGQEIYHGSDNENMPFAERVGYNTCRAELIKKINEVKK